MLTIVLAQPDTEIATCITEIGLPFTVFIDKRGRIVTLRLGELKEKEAAAILDTVAALDNGTLPFSQAKSVIREALRSH